MDAKTQMGSLNSSIPILDWLPHYKSEWLRFDIVTALSVWALLVLQGMLNSLPETSIPTLIVGVINIALLLLFRRYLPKLSRTIVVMVIGILVCDLMGLEKYGEDSIYWTVRGAIADRQKSAGARELEPLR